MRNEECKVRRLIHHSSLSLIISNLLFLSFHRDVRRQKTHSAKWPIRSSDLFGQMPIRPNDFLGQMAIRLNYLFGQMTYSDIWPFWPNDFRPNGLFGLVACSQMAFGRTVPNSAYLFYKKVVILLQDRILLQQFRTSSTKNKNMGLFGLVALLKSSKRAA